MLSRRVFDPSSFDTLLTLPLNSDVDGEELLDWVAHWGRTDPFSSSCAADCGDSIRPGRKRPRASIELQESCQVRKTAHPSGTSDVRDAATSPSSAIGPPDTDSGALSRTFRYPRQFEKRSEQSRRYRNTPMGFALGGATEAAFSLASTTF